MLTEKLHIDTKMEMLARGTSASLGVGDNRRVVQRVKLYMCVREKDKKRALDCMLRETCVVCMIGSKSEGEKEG